MSNVSTSPSASPLTNDAGRVRPAPGTPGQTGHQQTPTQREHQPQTTTIAPPPDTAVTLAPTLARFSEGESVAITVLGRDPEGRQIVQALHSVLVTLDPEVLPELATATIRVTGIAHDHLRVQLTSVDGETVPTPHTILLRVVQVSFPQDPMAPPQPSAGAAAVPPVMQVGTVVQEVTTSPPVAVAQNTAAPTHWPTGTTIVLEAVDLRPDGQTTAIATASVVAASTAARPIDQILMTLGEDWSALRDLSKHTATAAPTTAQAFVDGKVPTGNARAAAQIMFFLSVLRSGDVTGWLGADMLRSLERSNQRGLVERLRDDFRQLRRLGDESSGNDWRLLLFPFAHGDRIEPIHMFVRGQRRDQADGDQDVRFVVDLKMSALGALQFDGLLHHQTFDLMVRSHADLGETHRKEISRIFSAGLESISYRGQVAFQTVKEFPVSPFSDLLGGRHTPGAVLA